MNFLRAKIFDSTLRDGAQAEGISFLVGDKIKIAKALDDLGVDFIEAGNPGSNQKDMEFFHVAKSLTFKHSKLVAFGSTRRCNTIAQDDANLNALLEAGTDYNLTITAKNSNDQVVDKREVSFHTNWPNAIENLQVEGDQPVKVYHEGQIYILRGEHVYDTEGKMVR